MAFRTSSSSSIPTVTPRVIPAQVNFLTIYNPTLGDTEETEREQIIFWAGKDELGTSRLGRKPSKDQDDDAEVNGSNKGKTEEQIVNERLRQIGLARGMVEFARNFATSHPLDTIETDRSRIVLYELEKDWWILASIDLTRLPVTALKTKSQDDPKQSQSQYEFSAREVSPAVFLRMQLIKAHRLFLMHHSATLWELYHKLGRVSFGARLTRYWEAFARRWDVLLHGNPAVDVYGDCVKLAGGGELGVGVGEEEWGSGEREVLEGFVERAEGLIECVVGRYGPAPKDNSKRKLDEEKLKGLGLEEKVKLGKEMEAETWLGAGEDPSPADGVIFSGMGTISRKSLATVSQWMEAIFKHGDSAYGIGENPASQRQKRKKPRFERKISEEQSRRSKGDEVQDQEVHPRLKSPKTKSPDWRRKAIENNAAPPGIPAPLVGTIERSLDEAVAKAAQRSGSKSPRSSPTSSPTKQKSQEEAMKGFSDSKDEASVFSMEGMKNIFSFGYGSSWTLNLNGFDKKEEKQEEKQDKSKPKTQAAKRPAEQLSIEKSPERRPPLHRSKSSGSRPATERLQEIDPNPEFSDEDVPFVQKLEQSIGKFLIGLSGDLENQEFDDSDEPLPLSNSKGRSQARIFLRTLTVELANAHYTRPVLDGRDRKASQTSNISRASAGSIGSVRSNNGPEPRTSAAASVDGARPISRHEKVQVAVYVHQPFIFVFLFELHTANLTMPGFYRAIHHQLGPLQKPLLQRTDPARVAERIATALNENTSAAMSAVKKHADANGNAIYDLVYDPSKNTIRTSVPNIPVPASPDSAIKTTATVSGSWYTLGIPIGTSNSPSTRLDAKDAKSKTEPWSRIEALNVHSQILNSYISTRTPTELERTVKTAKGWWVLWMKVSPPGKESEEFKEAFLVRKSADFIPVGGKSRDGRRSESGSSSPAGRWLLRDQSREASSASHASAGATTGAKGVSEGVGIDARKWIEGLLSLTQ